MLEKSTRGRQSIFWTRWHRQVCRSRQRGGADGQRAEPTGFSVYSWAPGTLCSKMLHVRQRAQLSLQHFDVDWQPGWEAVGLECLKYSLGFRIPCIHPEAGAETHTASELYRHLAIVKPLTFSGLCRWRKRLVLMNEWGLLWH